MNILIGFIIGFLSSFVVWYILYHKIVPKGIFFDKIYKEITNENPSGYRYMIRLRNVGKRKIIDVEFFARLRIQGIYAHRHNSWKAIYIPLDGNRIPEIKSHREDYKKIALQICPALISEIAKRSLPEGIRKKIEDETILLEDLMNIGDNTELQLFGFGYDAFSGSKKMFSYYKYTKDDIEPK